jgi:hypothetical protein
MFSLKQAVDKTVSWVGRKPMAWVDSREIWRFPDSNQGHPL